MQRARSMLRCSLFSLFEGKVMSKNLSLQTFPPLFLQLIATIFPKGDKSAKPLQKLSIQYVFFLFICLFPVYFVLLSVKCDICSQTIRVNDKLLFMYPYDTIFSIFKRIGKRVPFQVKRSHKGKGVTDIKYRYSQEGYSFMVEKVINEGDKYEAYGYCMVNGIRDDLCVRKYYKGEIPNASANGWVLIDVPGVDMNEIFPVHTANEVIKSGKHRGKTFAEVYKEDPKYIDWLRNSNPHFKIDILSLSGASADNEDIIGRLLDEYVKTHPMTKVEDRIPFGKYKGKTYRYVYSIDPKYVNWLINNCDTIDFDILSFKHMMDQE